MNFKKKAIIGIAAGLFAVATVFNMNPSEQNKAIDNSLAAIEVMSKAEAESPAQYCRYVGGICAFTTYTGSYCPLYACMR